MSQALGKMMSTRITWQSSRSKKKKRKRFVSRSKKRGRSRKLHRLSAAPNLPRLRDYDLKLRLQRKRPGVRLMQRKSDFVKFKKMKSLRECESLRLPANVLPRKKLTLNARLWRTRRIARKSWQR